MKKSATFAVLFVVLFLMENAVYAQTAVRGATQVPVGPGVSGIVFHGINKTNIEICDFTLYLSPSSGAKIINVTVRSDQLGGAGDWDVDDDKDGFTQSGSGLDAEMDNSVGPVGYAGDNLVRIDCFGDGYKMAGGVKVKELGEDTRGEAIKQESPDEPGTPTFTLDINFLGNTTAPGELWITPTDCGNRQISSSGTGLGTGETAFVAHNATTIFPGICGTALNQTGDAIVGLSFETTGDYSLVSAWEIDPLYNIGWNEMSCGNAIQFDYPILESVMPMLDPNDTLFSGNINLSSFTAAFELDFTNMSSGDFTTLTVTPTTTPYSVFVPYIEVVDDSSLQTPIFVGGSGLGDVSSGTFSLYWNPIEIKILDIVPGENTDNPSFEFEVDLTDSFSVDVSWEFSGGSPSGDWGKIADILFDIKDENALKKAEVLQTDPIFPITLYAELNNGTIYPATRSGGIVVRPFSETAVEDKSQQDKTTPDRFTLCQNYPNPFNSSTTIWFSLRNLNMVSLKVFDALGRELQTLLHERKQPGEHRLDWNAGDLPSGIYLLRLKVGDQVATQKLILQR